MAKQEKAPVSLRALIQRINRRLKADGQKLKATRGDRGRSNLGDFYIVNPNRNWIVNTRVDPEALGRQLGVLHSYERVED